MKQEYTSIINSIIEIAKTSESYNRLKAEDVKILIKEIISDWLKNKDVTAFIRVETIYLNYKIGYKSTDRKQRVYIDAIGLTNGIGGIKGNNYLNKVYLHTNDGTTYKVRTHRARTDPKFLHPFEEEFLEFFQGVMNDINRLR